MNILVCEHCALAIANDEATEDHYNRMNTNGNIGDDEIVIIDFDSDPEFRLDDCFGCGDHLAGDRFKASLEAIYDY